MYCRKLKNGKWSCTADATPDPLTGKRRQVTRRGDTKKEAQQRTTEAVEQLSNERNTKKRTVNEVFEEWIKIYAETVRPSTVQTRRVQINDFLKKHGNHYIAALMTKDIQEHLFERRDRGVRYNSLSGTRTALNLLFQHALKNNYVDRNIVKHTTLPKAARSTNHFVDADKKYLEKDEISNFLKGLKSTGRRNAYEIALVMLSTGLRIGEVLALTWDDINIIKKELTVNKTLFSRKRFDFVPPKTPASYRTVSFNDEVSNIFKKMKVQYNKELLVGVRNKQSKWCDLVFTGIRSQPIQASTISAVFNRTYKIHGIDVSGTHILRHTHITMLVEAGVDLPVIMERVGHSNINITLDIYTHVTKKMQESSDQKINEYFRQFIVL